MKLNSHKTGLVFGALLGLDHLVWSILVAAGWAKPLLDRMLGLHFINVSYSLNPFSAGKALLLIIVTSVVGYIAGYIFAALWNWLHG